jgi:hypothetical protein
MKKIAIVFGVLVLLAVLGAGGVVYYEYHDHDVAMAESERIVNELDANLTKQEKDLEAATGGDPSRSPSPETEKIADAILKIRKDAGVEAMVMGMGGSRSKFISEKRKTAHEEHIKAVLKRCDQVLEKYHFVQKSA